MSSKPPMDAKAYTAALGELRGVRDDIKATRKELETLQRELQKLQTDRDARVVALGEYAKANADRIAPAAGLTIEEVTALVPALGLDRAVAEAQSAPAAAPTEPVPGAPAPDLRRPDLGTGTAAPVPAEAQAADDGKDKGVQDEPAAEPVAAARTAVAPAVPEGTDRELPSIPVGERGDAWMVAAKDLVSLRPRFTQQVWDTAFLDVETGTLVHKANTGRVDVGSRSAADILAAVSAVSAVLPESVERIYIPGGDPWHRDADRFPHLTDAVVDWLNAPVPGWTVASGKGQAEPRRR